MRGVEIVFQSGAHAAFGFFCELLHLRRFPRSKLGHFNSRLEVTQPPHRMRRLFKASKSKVQLLGVRDRGKQVADGRRLVALEQQVAQGKEVALALGHLLAFHQQEAHVHPEAGEGLAGERFRLRDFVFMVGKCQVFAAGVQVKALAQILH